MGGAGASQPALVSFADVRRRAEAYACHAGGQGRLDARSAVLDYNAVLRRDAEPVSGVQEDVGRGLAPFHPLGAKHAPFELLLQAEHVQAQCQTLRRARGSNAVRDVAEEANEG